MSEEDARDGELRWAPHDHFADVIVSAAEREKAAYEHGVERPIGSYAVVTTVYVAAATLLSLLARDRRSQLRLSGRDLALATIATAKVSRVVAKDPVTSFLRARSLGPWGARGRPSWRRRCAARDHDMRSESSSRAPSASGPGSRG